jgi:hypothetical protein
MPRLWQCLPDNFSYYVDSVAGDDGNLGTSPNAPWKSMTPVNAVNLTGKKGVGFKRGSGPYDRLTNGASGTAGSPIIYGAYGVGATPLMLTTEWVWFNGAALQYVTVQDLDIRSSHATGWGIQLTGAGVGVRILRNVVHNCLQVGIGITYTAGSLCEVAYNTITGCGDNGVAFEGVATGWVHHNESYANGGNGIECQAASDLYVHHNKCHHNTAAGGEGIGLETTCTASYVYNNLVYHNTNAGLLTNSPLSFWYHNTSYGNKYQMVLCDWSASVPIDNTIENNIFGVTAVGQKGVMIVDNGSGGAWDQYDNVWDYNDYFYTAGPDKSNMVDAGGSDHTFAQWVATHGKEAHGQCVDPSIVNDATHNYHLLVGSAIRGDGLHIVSVADDLDAVARANPPDIGCYQYV